MTTAQNDYDLLINLRTAVDRVLDDVIATRVDGADFSGFHAKYMVQDLRVHFNQLDRHLAGDSDLRDFEASRLRIELYQFIYQAENDPHVDQAKVAALACSIAAFFDRSGL